MRAFLSSHISKLLLCAPLMLALSACGEEREKESPAPKTPEVKEETKAESKPEAPAKAEEKSHKPTNTHNIKIDTESDEPALVVLSKLNADDVVARVGDDVITVADLLDALKTSPAQMKALPLSKVYFPLAKRVRDMRALVKAADNAKVGDLPEIKQKIKEANEAVKVKHYIDERIEKKITPEFMKEKFDEFMKIYKKDGQPEKEFRLQVIMMKTKEEGDAMIARIKKGERFEDLAQESSDERVRKEKGELGYVRFSDLPKEIATRIQKSATGVVVDTPFKLGEDKWAVFKKMDQRDLPDPSFDEVAPELKKIVMPQFFGEVLKDVLKEMKSEIIDYKTGGILDEAAEEEKAKAEMKAAMEAQKAKLEAEQKGAPAAQNPEAPPAA